MNFKKIIPGMFLFFCPFLAFASSSLILENGSVEVTRNKGVITQDEFNSLKAKLL